MGARPPPAVGSGAEAIAREYEAYLQWPARFSPWLEPPFRHAAYNDAMLWSPTARFHKKWLQHHVTGDRRCPLADDAAQAADPGRAHARAGAVNFGANLERAGAAAPRHPHHRS